MIFNSIQDLKAQELSLVWLRRDLRLGDNAALSHALAKNTNVLLVFIFDADIIDELPKDDPRVAFIHSQLESINNRLLEYGSSMMICKGRPQEVWSELKDHLKISSVYFNKDYEPYAKKRDSAVSKFLKNAGIEVHSFKDHVVFEESEVMKDDGTPYTVFTPYKKKWLSQFKPSEELKPDFGHLVQHLSLFPSLLEIGLLASQIKVRPYSLEDVASYAETRNFPDLDNTSYLGPHLRFGTVGVRQLIRQLKSEHETFLSELIWREFFIQVLHHFPHVVTSNFRSKYDGIRWRNDSEEFKLWCKGKTGYPLVDAGMRQLNTTGYMHNRVRMVAASFLCKHLLIDWRWGEAYFAKKLLDFDLASNNGNWQWAAGTGCDAAPYFRVFNPAEQMKKFDSKGNYVRMWVEEFDSLDYPTPMIEHRFARNRALETYKAGISA